MTPDSMADGLVPDGPGLWVAASSGEEVSYPAGGSAFCLGLEDRSFRFRHRNRCIVDLVRRFPPAGTVWDVGGGNGFVTRGRLYLTVPAHGWLWSDNDRHSGHFRRYGEGGLRRLLAGHRFRVEWSSPFFGPLVLPILLLRSLPGRVGLARAGDARRTARQHAPGGPAPALLGRLLEREARRLARGERVALGSSLLLTASAV